MLPLRNTLIETSFERKSVLLLPAITYSGIDKISIPKIIVTKFVKLKNYCSN